MNEFALLLLAFLAITFLQSGIDKISDWNGNLSFLKEHFSSITDCNDSVTPTAFFKELTINAITR